MSHSQGAEREECWPSDCFPLLIHCRTLPPSVVPPTVRVGLLHSVKPVCEHPSRYTQSYDSMAILTPIKLAVKINCQDI